MGEFSGAIEITSKEAKSIYATDQGRTLGTRAVTGDGRTFRWMLNGATALGMGIPVISAAIEVLEKDTEYTAVINDTEDISTTWRSITVDSEAATGEIAANDYADGYIRVANSTAANAKGQLVSIKSNDASATSSTDALGSTMTVTFADDDALTAALDTGALLSLHHNPYWKVVVCAGGADSALAGGVMGVPIRPVTAAYYFWGQTWGACAVVQDATITTGASVIVSTSTSEAVGAASTYTTSTELAVDISWGAAEGRQPIGWKMGSPGTDAYYELIFLTIAP